jgi:type I restriction enzyme, S subunit
MKPGYKQTEVGVIPEEWEITTTTEACDLVVDCKNRTPPVVADSDYAVVRTPNVRDGQFVLEELRFTDEASYHQWTARAIPQFGDIMITREAPLGEVCAVPAGRKVCLGQRMMLYRPALSKTDTTYLLYALMSQPVKASLLRRIGGSTVGHAKVDEIRFLQLPLPPLPEQRAIATALSDMDALLASLDRLIAKQRDLKQAAMQQLLTGQTRLPGFTGEWETKTLPDVSRFRGGKAHEQYIADHGRFVCVNSKFISTEGKVRKYSTANFCSAKAKDILMVMSDLPNGKALAKTFVADQDDFYAVNQRVCALTPFEDYCAEFLAYVLDRNPYFLKFDDGVSQTHLLNRVFQKCPVFVPLTKAEQTAIATVLSDMDLELAALEQRRDKTCALKQGMMQELLTARTRLV